jgi:glutamine phosphoribosylpyrophosphate amidotransferase
MEKHLQNNTPITAKKNNISYFFFPYPETGFFASLRMTMYHSSSYHSAFVKNRYMRGTALLQERRWLASRAC